jgi:hypothetical protein
MYLGAGEKNHLYDSIQFANVLKIPRARKLKNLDDENDEVDDDELEEGSCCTVINVLSDHVFLIIF